MNRTLVVLAAFLCLTSIATAQGTYPLSPDSACGSLGTCQDVIDTWNGASWADLVDDGFNTGPLALAAVRWYCTEGDCSGGGQCNDQLQNGDGCCRQFSPAPPDDCPNPDLDTETSTFWGVTDELSNVLLSYALGTDQAAYEKLHNFAELLRHPAINNLQCWKYQIQGVGLYDSYDDLCAATDSASDASLRILHAYSIACAKQEAGAWNLGSVDYCADYLEQGNAIWGNGTISHGEIKLLPSGEYFLANGYNNQAGAPTATDSFRPDYYELAALMHFANYINEPAFQQGVRDMLSHYALSLGDNHIHCGKTGHFDFDREPPYCCDQLCSPPYMDNADTWRAVTALSTFRLQHPADVSPALDTEIFDHWWNSYAGGHPTNYGPTDTKPFEIYCNSADGTILTEAASYQTQCMWLPLGAIQDAAYTQAAIDHLVNTQYSSGDSHFWGAEYYGGYYSQFCQRAIGAATGLLDPTTWHTLFTDGFETGDTSNWASTVP